MKLWARRHRNLSSSRTQIACRLHAVLCDLVAGGVPDEIYAEKAASLLAEVEADSAVAAARIELAEELLDDLRRVDRQIVESKKRLEQVVAASGTTVINIFGVGPVVAATVVEVSSGGRKVWRLSRRGNRTLNHAIHMAAVTQLRFAHSPGRGYYDRKIAEGKTPKEALRALKRRISDVLWVAMVADARRAAAASANSQRAAGPGGQPGNDSVASAAGSHPETPALRPSHSRTRTKATTASSRARRPAPRSSAQTSRRTA
jgi:transposase